MSMLKVAKSLIVQLHWHYQYQEFSTASLSWTFPKSECPGIFMAKDQSGFAPSSLFETSKN